MEVPIVVGAWCDDPRSETVACVVDGDTLDVGACGDELGERIRLLGVAAPEIAHDPEPEECYGDEAFAYLNQITDQADVRLEFDLECIDIYGRTLAWIFLEGDADDQVADVVEDFDQMGLQDDGTYKVLVNQLMIRAGYATVYDEAFTNEERYLNKLIEAEQLAEADGLGLWQACP